jgi:hypothetical protein
VAKGIALILVGILHEGSSALVGMVFGNRLFRDRCFFFLAQTS